MTTRNTTRTSDIQYVRGSHIAEMLGITHIYKQPIESEALTAMFKSAKLVIPAIAEQEERAKQACPSCSRPHWIGRYYKNNDCGECNFFYSLVRDKPDFTKHMLDTHELFEGMRESIVLAAETEFADCKNPLYVAMQDTGRVKALRVDLIVKMRDEMEVGFMEPNVDGNEVNKAFKKWCSQYKTTVKSKKRRRELPTLSDFTDKQKTSIQGVDSTYAFMYEWIDKLGVLLPYVNFGRTVHLLERLHQHESKSGYFAEMFNIVPIWAARNFQDAYECEQWVLRELQELRRGNIELLNGGFNTVETIRTLVREYAAKHGIELEEFDEMDKYEVQE